MAIARIQPADSREQLKGVVQDVKRAWRAGQTPDVGEVVREYPEVLHYRTLIVDLAYEAYCLRESGGQTPETAAFLQEMPAYRTQIQEVIFGHRELADNFGELEAQHSAWPEVGDRLESLTILSELGRGSFAQVYLAQDANLGNRHVVLKLSAFPSYEGHTLGTIDHSNIGRVFWARKLGGHYAICMPYVGSTTLGDIVESAPNDGAIPSRAGEILKTIEKTSTIPPEDSVGTAQPTFTAKEPFGRAIARIGVQLAEALAYLHAKGIVHGDIKPSNILLDHLARPYLIDFNMAHQEGDWLLRFGGTLPYMAPEALDPSRPKCSPSASEVFSLGVVLYQSLTGRLPHDPAGSDLREVAKNQFARKRTGCAPIRTLNRKIPRRVARVIDASLSVEPAKRPSAERMAKELRAVTTPPRWSLLFGILIAIMLVGAAGKNLILPEKNLEISPPKLSPATQEEFFARGVTFLEAGDVTLAMKDFDVARGMKPDGKTLAYIGYCLSKSGRDRDAEVAYREAIDAGYAPVWVHNNRAFAMMQYGQNVPSLLKAALESAQKARDLGPPKREVRLNWVFASFLVAMNGTPKVFDDPACVQELKAALAEGSVDADLCIRAAWVLSASGSDHHLEALSLLHKAVTLGRNPKAVLLDPFLRFHLAKHPDFQAIEQLTPGPKSAANIQLRLMRPAP